MMKRTTAMVASLLLLGAAGCGDLLEPNVNEPATAGVVSTPNDAENLIAGAFLSAWDATTGYTAGYDPAINAQMSAMAFEHSPMAANFGMIERSAMPRLPINNTPTDTYIGQYGRVWYGSYRAIVAANDGLRAIASGLVIEDEDGTDVTPRAEAFARFAQGLGHAHLALTYDQAFVYPETADPAVEPLELVPYDQVMDAALGMLDQAIAIAEANEFTLPAGWINGNSFTEAQFIQLIHSYQARFRAQVARNPAERDAVDWTAVIADVDAGVTEDVEILFDDNNWQYVLHVYFSFRGAWNQMNYFVLGMADQSGAYQSWMDLPVADRTPFVMVTPDLRFPQGTNETEQRAAPGKYIVYKGAGGGHVRSDRGTWRWSYYVDDRNTDYYAGTAGSTWTGPLPVLTVAEMQLLKAEGLLRGGQDAAAATIINETRVASGGLQPVAPGVNLDCVPKLPDGSCGDLMEALKWEKRLEAWGAGFGAWYFDSRGWGDLAAGTPIHYPVPATELQVLELPLYSFGGSLEGSAPVGTYGY